MNIFFRKTVISFLAVSFLLAFFSCKNIFKDEPAIISSKTPAEKKVLFNGTISDVFLQNGAMPSEFVVSSTSETESSRAVIPNTKNGTYLVTAETVEKAVDGETPLKTAAATVNENKTFSVMLAAGYKWKITVTMQQTVNGSPVNVLTDTYTMETELSYTSDIISHNFILKPLSEGGGYVNLVFSNANGKYDSLSVEYVTKNGEDVSTLWNNSVQISSTSLIVSKAGVTLPCGTYTIVIAFKKSGKTVYKTMQEVNVFPNMNTNTWKVTEDCIDSNGYFYLTDDMIASFEKTSLIFVNNNTGNDDNTGTPYSPLKTLNAAISRIQAASNEDDYLIYIDGTVSVTESINISSTISASSIKITGISSGKLNGSGNLLSVGIENVTLKNIEIAGSIEVQSPVILEGSTVIDGEVICSAENISPIIISGTLTPSSANGIAANIRPYSYSAETALFVILEDSGAELETEYLKFAVTPQTVAIGETTADQLYTITSEGMLKKIVNTSIVAYQITSMTESGTINVDGVMQNSDFVFGNTIGTALNTLKANNSSVMVTLDLSGVEGVTELGENAFNGKQNLIGIMLPTGITKIGKNAFYNARLTSIVIPEGVTDIQDGAFSSCTSLSTVSFPSTLNAFDENSLTFSSCDNLLEITVADGNPYLSSQNGVLYNGDKTVLVKYPAKKTDTEFSIPNTVTKIDGSAFSGCKNLTSVTIPEGVVSINQFAFFDCQNISTVNLPESLTKIGNGAFRGSGITSVNISKNVTSIGTNVFSLSDKSSPNPSALTQITVDPDNPSYSSLDGVLYNKKKTKLMQYPPANTRTSLSIPKTVQTIDSYAFAGSTKLQSVVIPQGVTTIPEYAFYCCDALQSFTIPLSVKNISNYATTGTNIKFIYYEGTETDKGTISVNYSYGNQRLNASATTWTYNTAYQIGDKTTPDAIGDVLFKDGTWSTYDSTLGFGKVQAAAAIGIVYDLDGTAPRGILGVKNSGENAYYWASASTQGCKNKIEDIQILKSNSAPTDGTPSYYYELESEYLTGDFDGSDNWKLIQEFDPEGTDAGVVEDNYPAFSFVNNYASYGGLQGDYANGWYMPSAVELSYIYNNRDTLDSVLVALNSAKYDSADTIGDQVYWTSSQQSSTDRSFAINMNTSELVYRVKNSAAKVCVIRSANTLPDYSVIFKTNGGSTVATQKVTSGQTASTPTTVPAKSGYAFAGWYSDKALTTEFDFDTPITDHTILYAKWNWNASVGDLLLSDGTIIAYNATRTDFSTELTAGKTPVGVVYDIDATGAPKGILGIKNSGDTKYTWAHAETTGTKTAFEDIQIEKEITEPAEGTVYFEYENSGTTYYLTGDLDGSDNWSQICAQDSEGTADEVVASNYPAFNYANTYAQTAELTGDYASGWYIPSVVELYCIYSNIETLNQVLSAVNSTSGFEANTLAGDYYWSSSQNANEFDEAWYVYLGNGYINSYEKRVTEYVCVVRSANAFPDYSVIFKTNGGTPVASQKVTSGQTASTPTTVPTKSGYVFAGWYSDKAHTAEFDFNTPITDHTIIYAKWEIVPPQGFVFVQGATVTDAVVGSQVFKGSEKIISNMLVCDHEVTQSEYETYCKYGDTVFTPHTSYGNAYGEGNDNPAFFVNWYDAIVYCNLRSKEENLNAVYSIAGETDPSKWEGIQKDNPDNPTKYCGPSDNNSIWNSVTVDENADGYRLPSLAEWEYIAREGNNGIPQTQYTYSGSDEIRDVAWYKENSGDEGGIENTKTHEVKKKNPNILGVYDMTGNVMEWCWDTYGDDEHRVIRGGYYDSPEESCALSAGISSNMAKTYTQCGFRVVRTVIE